MAKRDFGPGAGHLAHMPSHIYYRIGRYKDSLAVNQRAVAVDETYLAQAKPEGLYPGGYYPHNVHFLMASAQMGGDGPTAVEAAAKLNQVISQEALAAIPLLHPIKAAYYFTHAQFSEPATVLALPDPGAQFPYLQGVWRYARGVAQAMSGNLEGARAESEAIGRLLESNDFADLKAWTVPAEETLQIAQRVVQGRIAQAQGELQQAIDHFQAAVVLQDALPYMEPPYWYYPVRQSLGAAYVAAGRLDEAEEAFRATLARKPNNGWALFGLTQVYEARGDRREAKAARDLLSEAWMGDRSQLELSKL
jgi:tetratricopeptide (TPR) repeat protein